MSLIQQLTTMVVDRMYRYLQKIPRASHEHTGILDEDNRTLQVQDGVVVAHIDNVTPSVITISTPTTTDGTTSMSVYNIQHIEMSLVATSLLVDPIPISHMEMYLNNDDCIIVVADSSGVCSCCITSINQYVDVVAVDVLGNRSDTSRIRIVQVTPKILTPTIILPSTDVVRGSDNVPYAIDSIRTVPHSDDPVSTTWELRGADNRLLWSDKTYTSHTLGPSVADLPDVVKSPMYYMEIDHASPISANTITTFRNRVYYTSDTHGSVYMLHGDVSELISIPELRYCYKAMSTDLLIVFCSSLYVVYSLDGVTWNTIQHPTSIVDVVLYNDVIYMLDTSGNIIRYNATTGEYYKTIQTSITGARSCTVDDLTLYLVTFDTAYTVDVHTGDVSVLYTSEYGNFKDISIIDNTIVVNNTRGIYYFQGTWSSMELDNDSIVKVVVRDNKLYILMSSGTVYMTTSKMQFTTLDVSSRELVDMTVTNNTCYITDNTSVYKTRPIVALSEMVTMQVRCISVDARYTTSDIVTRTYRYQLT